MQNITMPTAGESILFGGDYNPEQWPRETWDEDMRLLKQAHVTSVTLNVFSWALLQPGTPDEETYDFSMLDDIVDTVTKAGLTIVMATSTGALPAWMTLRHPDINRVDFQGRRHRHGGRHNPCPSSPTYREFAPKLAGLIAKRYAHLDNLVCWHISNEMSGYCYCDNCAAAFRVWLKNRYGSVEALNAAWTTNFWGHTYHSFKEIFPPNELGDAVDENRSLLPALTLDYRRFMSDAARGIYNLEVSAVRENSSTATHTIPVTTNFMLDFKDYDYFTWAKDLDVVAWDCYPSYDTAPSHIAMWHDLMRGLKGGPFMLMEQTPSRANWQPFNSMKKPGQMRAQSYQAMAHGADTIQFFQMRRSQAGCEKFHGAVIENDGTSDTRVFRETAALGEELKKLGTSVAGSTVHARVAVIFDWQSWWGMLGSVGPSVSLDYLTEIDRYYSELYRRHIPVDMVSKTSDLSGYDAVFAPCLYMVDEPTAANLRTYVRGGGRLVVTTMSSIANENDRCHLGGAPSPLRDVFGVWAEETDALAPGTSVPLEFAEDVAGSVAPAGSLLCDIVRTDTPAEAGDSTQSTATILATYGGDDYYAGAPAVTVNEFGKGQGFYVATMPNSAALATVVSAVLSGLDAAVLEGGNAVVESASEGLEGTALTFVIDMAGKGGEVRLSEPRTDVLTGRTIGGPTASESPLTLEKFGVLILQ
jgi:beta-galactosidase